MSEVYLKCGHSAHAVKKTPEGNVPWCVICDCGEVVVSPTLEGRTAHCFYRCGNTKPSRLSLAFFEYKPDKDEDEYYCGCFGWD